MLVERVPIIVVAAAAAAALHAHWVNNRRLKGDGFLGHA
jgi:hypothetical protein